MRSDLFSSSARISADTNKIDDDRLLQFLSARFALIREYLTSSNKVSSSAEGEQRWSEGTELVSSLDVGDQEIFPVNAVR
jgi:hypothetical protein